MCQLISNIKAAMSMMEVCLCFVLILAIQANSRHSNKVNREIQPLFKKLSNLILENENKLTVNIEDAIKENIRREGTESEGNFCSA